MFTRLPGSTSEDFVESIGEVGFFLRPYMLGRHTRFDVLM
jgi:hypothetical protein